jgi:hypothetical protein
MDGCLVTGQDFSWLSKNVIFYGAYLQIRHLLYFIFVEARFFAIAQNGRRLLVILNGARAQ